ncbi:MAG: ATP-binding cassette domain-containing protein [Proteobacteria bacterium]|nr:ATP-binding cassette domain-containing protein [Pseudomonadota bacterium]
MGKRATLIRLREITFGYDSNRDVLRKLNFTFSEGDRVGLTGPNGSGKTTLFHTILGLLKPKEGEIEIFGKGMNTEADFREARERIGLLFQDPNDQLFCPTVAEDVAFGPLNLGKRYDEAQRIVSETLKTLGLAGFEDRVTYKLSDGERRLVSLATILAMNPEILLLDEPTSGLDEETTDRIVRVLNRSSKSYVIISQDRGLLAKTTRCTYRMASGKLEEPPESSSI